MTQEANIRIELSPLQKQYYDLKAKYPSAILLFRTGDFYTMYEEDAVVCSKTLGITLSLREGRKEAAFPHHALDMYLPKLVRAGYRLAICDQLESPKKVVRKSFIEELFETKKK